MYEILVTWWLIDGTAIHERFGAFPTEAICQAHLEAHFETLEDRRWSGRRVEGLGGCFLKRAAAARVRVAEGSAL